MKLFIVPKNSEHEVYVILSLFFWLTFFLF